MEDSKIVSLYWERDERAIFESNAKYGRYCYSIAHNITQDPQDADESVNDTWLHAWRSMPPHRPAVLSLFLGKLTRRISLNRWRDQHRKKRGAGEVTLALEELEECIPDAHSVEETVEVQELSKVICAFIDTLPATEQRMFVCRYWFLASNQEIGNRFGYSESKVKSKLFRIRTKLKAHLKEVYEE